MRRATQLLVPIGALVAALLGTPSATAHHSFAVHFVPGTAARYKAWTRRPGEFVFPYDCDPGYRE